MKGILFIIFIAFAVSAEPPREVAAKHAFGSQMMRKRGPTATQPFTKPALAFFKDLGKEDSNHPVEHKADLVYCKSDKLKLELDLVIPEGGKRFPAVMFIHGGGFISGSRKGPALDLAHAVAKKGFVGVSVDFRLSGGPDSDKDKSNDKYQVVASFPDPVVDVRCAVRWLKHNAKDYKINPTRIGAVGLSSGGYFALSLALSGSEKPYREGDLSPEARSEEDKVQAGVNLFGPTSMELQYYHDLYSDFEPVAERFLGADAPSFRELYRKANLANMVNPQASPMFSVSPSKDELFPPDHTREFDRVVRRLKGFHSYVPLPDLGQGFVHARTKRFDQASARQTMETVFEFLENTLIKTIVEDEDSNE